MNEDLAHMIAMVVGAFTISCLASTYYYGSFASITWLLGLFLFAALLSFIFDNS